MCWHRPLVVLIGLCIVLVAGISVANDAPKDKGDAKEVQKDKDEPKDKATTKDAQKDKESPKDKAATKEVKTEKGPNYYPLSVGNQWHYKVSVGENSVTAVSTITKLETMEIVNDKKESQKIQVARLEASVNDEVKATEHLRQTDKGVFRFRNNGQEISPPICLLKYPVKSGTKWDGEITVGTDKGKYSCVAAEETIEVAAGKFKAMKVAIKLESKGKTVDTTYWFVLDVGFVKQTVEAEGIAITMELEKFVKKGGKK